MKLINEEVARKIWEGFTKEDKEAMYEKEAFELIYKEDGELKFENFYDYLVATLLSNTEWDLHVSLPEEI